MMDGQRVAGDAECDDNDDGDADDGDLYSTSCNVHDASLDQLYI